MQRTLLAFACLLSFACPSQTALEDRLLLTSRVWGHIKYFHPACTSCQVNWDSVLVANLPAVAAATADTAFAATLQKFFSAAGPVPLPSTPNPVIPPGSATNLDLSWFSHPALGTSIKQQLDTIQRRFRPAPVCKVAALNSGIQFLDQLENVPGSGLPEKEKRLLVAFRYWNYIEYFFNSRNLTDVPWPQTLRRIVMQLDTAGSELSYQLSILELISAIDDTHATSAISPLLTQHFGTYLPPIVVEPIEGKAVVTKVLSGASGKVKVGDIITHVNGEPIDTVLRRRQRYVAGSNSGAQLLHLLRGVKCIFRGAPFSALFLQLSDAGGTYTTSLIRSLTPTAHYQASAYNGPSYSTLTAPGCTLGYVHMGALALNEVPLMYDSLKTKSAIIFDLRNYPNGTGYDICKKLTDSAYLFAHMLKPNLQHPGVVSHTAVSMVFPDNVHPYQGKIYVLVNAHSISQSEFTAMMFQGLGAQAVLVGSQTAGADGDVTMITLPGNITSAFSTLQVRYPDNYNTQRIGVRIDHTVAPSIAGTRAGADEVLDYVLALNQCNPLNTTEEERRTLRLYPNPARSHCVLEFEEQAATTVDLLDMLGRHLVLKTSDGRSPLVFDLTDLGEGLYTIKYGNQVQRLIIAR